MGGELVARFDSAFAVPRRKTQNDIAYADMYPVVTHKIERAQRQLPANNGNGYWLQLAGIVQELTL